MEIEKTAKDNNSKILVTARRTELFMQTVEKLLCKWTKKMSKIVQLSVV